MYVEKKYVGVNSMCMSTMMHLHPMLIIRLSFHTILVVAFVISVCWSVFNPVPGDDSVDWWVVLACVLLLLLLFYDLAKSFHSLLHYPYMKERVQRRQRQQHSHHHNENYKRQGQHRKNQQKQHPSSTEDDDAIKNNPLSTDDVSVALRQQREEETKKGEEKIRLLTYLFWHAENYYVPLYATVFYTVLGAIVVLGLLVRHLGPTLRQQISDQWSEQLHSFSALLSTGILWLLLLLLRLDYARWHHTKWTMFVHAFFTHANFHRGAGDNHPDNDENNSNDHDENNNDKNKNPDDVVSESSRNENKDYVGSAPPLPPYTNDHHDNNSNGTQQNRALGGKNLYGNIVETTAMSQKNSNANYYSQPLPQKKNDLYTNNPTMAHKKPHLNEMDGFGEVGEGGNKKGIYGVVKFSSAEEEEKYGELSIGAQTTNFELLQSSREFSGSSGDGYVGGGDGDSLNGGTEAQQETLEKSSYNGLFLKKPMREQNQQYDTVSKSLEIAMVSRGRKLTVKEPFTNAHVSTEESKYEYSMDIVGENDGDIDVAVKQKISLGSSPPSQMQLCTENTPLPPPLPPSPSPLKVSTGPKNSTDNNDTKNNGKNGNAEERNTGFQKTTKKQKKGGLFGLGFGSGGFKSKRITDKSTQRTMNENVASLVPLEEEEEDDNGRNSAQNKNDKRAKMEDQHRSHVIAYEGLPNSPREDSGGQSLVNSLFSSKKME